MANNYFQFKQFIIYQDKCAMKVCTDACLFGAWAADITKKNEGSPIKNILDIGAGTGLISLMMAQKTVAPIDAVEIDQEAFEQAKQNFERSVWKERMHMHHSSIQDFAINDKKYDIIISNPPFYDNDLRSESDKKNKAKHNTTLTLQELAAYAAQALTKDGSLFILLPFHRVKDMIVEADKNGLFLTKELLVKQTPKHDFFRSCLQFSRKKNDITVNKLCIKNEEDKYSCEFALLLKEYYLTI